MSVCVSGKNPTLLCKSKIMVVLTAYCCQLRIKTCANRGLENVALRRRQEIRL